MNDNEDTLPVSPVEDAPRPPDRAAAPTIGAAVISRAVCLSIAIVAAGLLVRLFVVHKAVEIHWALQVTLGTLAMSSSSVGLRLRAPDFKASSCRRCAG